MSIALRALNEFDIELNPQKNGLISKKLIYDLTKDYLATNNKEYFNSLDEQEKDQYIKENMLIYLQTHQNKISKNIAKRTFYIEDLYAYEFQNKNRNAQRYVLLQCCLSTLNNHLINGSRSITEWLSATTSLKALKKYYDTQKVHQVAVVNLDGLSKKTIVLNLTSKECIAKINHIFVNKIDEENAAVYYQLCEFYPDLAAYFKDNLTTTTDARFRGFNYATSDSEICIYQFVPSSNISNVLNALETELIMYSILDTAFLKMPPLEQKDFLNTLKKHLENQIRVGGSDTLNAIYDALFIKNLSEKSTGLNFLTEEKINGCHYQILKIASNIPMQYIKPVKQNITRVLVKEKK